MSRIELYDKMYNRTFSGTDTLAFMIFPSAKPILLGSLTTISYSTYRDKKPVTLIGRINVGGFTRGMRVVAGSMVFTLINQHIVKDILEQIPYLSQYKRLKIDELPMFDIMIISANEYGAASKMMIFGVDVTDESQVISIQDIFTENTFNFVARDIEEFTAYKDTIVKGSSRGNNKVTTINSFNFEPRINNIQKNTELIKIQEVLKENNIISKVNGVYDNETILAITQAQKNLKLTATGILDDTTYQAIMYSYSNNLIDYKILKTNKYEGCNVYIDDKMSSILQILKYNTSIIAVEEEHFYKVKINNINGYISKSDVDILTSYDIDFKTECGEYYIKDINYEDIGAIIKFNEDTDIKISAISEYNNKQKECYSKTIKALQNLEEDININLLNESYIYNLSKNSKPIKITFIIYAKDLLMYKWILKDGDNIE